MSVHGPSDYLEQPSKEGWRQNGGAYRQRVWEGPASGITLFLGSYLPQGYSEYEIEDAGDLKIVRALYTAETPGKIGNASDDGLVERYWEMDGDDLERSLWAHPKIVEATKFDTAEKAAILRSLIEKILSGEIQQITRADGAEVFDEFIARLAKGVEAFEESRFVLRKVETVRKNSIIRPAFTNLKRVFTYTRLLASEPSLAYENLIQASNLIDLEWLKGPPKVRPTQDGLWQITQEYKAAKTWDRWIYPEAA